jgi:hypothetical protein
MMQQLIEADHDCVVLVVSCTMVRDRLALLIDS